MSDSYLGDYNFDSSLDALIAGDGFIPVYDGYGENMDNMTSPFGASPLEIPGETLFNAGESLNPSMPVSESKTPASEPGLLDKVLSGANAVGKFTNDNSKAIELITGMIGGAYTAQEKRDAVQALAQEKIDTRNRISDSMVKMKRPTIGKPSSLKRLDGSEVYNKDGSFAK